MKPSQTARLVIVGGFLLLFIGWWAFPGSDSFQRTGLNGVRLMASDKVLTTVTTIQQLFVPSINPSAPPTPSPEPVESTALPTAPVTTPSPATPSTTACLPLRPDTPTRIKRKTKSKIGLTGRVTIKMTGVMMTMTTVMTIKGRGGRVVAATSTP